MHSPKRPTGPHGPPQRPGLEWPAWTSTTRPGRISSRRTRPPASMRHLGPRSAKHLSDLVQALVDDGIDADFTWRGDRTGHPRRTSLQRQSALAIRDAIKLNEVSTTEVDLTGKLVTISSVSQAELQADHEGRIRLSVSPELAEKLGPFYNHQVIVRVERITMWSTQTGQEKRTFRLLAIRQEFGEPGADQEQGAANPTT
jgi:hypothetical protein